MTEVAEQFSDSEMSPTVTTDPGLKIHILRCDECGFESVDKTRFDVHRPCVLRVPALPYVMHRCTGCCTVSTSLQIMREHRHIYHALDNNVSLVEMRDQLKPHLLSPPPQPPADGDVTACRIQTTSSSASTATTADSNNNSVMVHSTAAIDFSAKQIMSSPGAAGLNLPLPHSRLPPPPPPPPFWLPGGPMMPPGLAPLFSSFLMQCSSSNTTKKPTLCCSICKMTLPSSDELIRHICFFHSGATTVTNGDGSSSLTGLPLGHPFHQHQQLSGTNNFLPPHNPAMFKNFPGLPPPPPSILSGQSNAWSMGKLLSRPPQPPPPPHPVVCPACKMLCLSLPQLDAHIAIAHPGPHCMFPIQQQQQHQQQQQTPQVTPARPSKLLVESDSCSKEHHKSTSISRDDSHKKSVDAITNSNSNGRLVSQTTSVAKSTIPVINDASEDAFAHIKANPQSHLIVHNTLRKTKSDLKVINRFLAQIKNEHRPVQDIPPGDMDAHLQDFVLNAKKKDGHEYEPESLKAFIHSLERYLKTFHNYPVSVLKDQQFSGTRSMLHQRLQELRLKSKNSAAAAAGPPGMSGCNSNSSGGSGARIGGSSGGQSINSIQDLIKYELIGHESPQALINTLWLINRVLFHIGGVHRHKNLVWGQFSLATVFGQTCLQYRPGPGGPGNSSSASGGMRSSADTTVSVGRDDARLPLDPVEVFQVYANMRPMESRGPGDPLYLCPDPVWRKGGAWFRPANAGFQYISKIPRLMGFKSSAPASVVVAGGPVANNSTATTASFEGDNPVSMDNSTSGQMEVEPTADVDEDAIIDVESASDPPLPLTIAVEEPYKQHQHQHSSSSRSSSVVGSSGCGAYSVSPKSYHSEEEKMDCPQSAVAAMPNCAAFTAALYSLLDRQQQQQQQQSEAMDMSAKIIDA